jgi:hypothetical protein
MTGTNCDLFTHNQSRSYLNHLVLKRISAFRSVCCWADTSSTVLSAWYQISDCYWDLPRKFNCKLQTFCATLTKLGFCWQIVISPQYQILTKIRPVGSQFIHADRRMDRQYEAKIYHFSIRRYNVELFIASLNNHKMQPSVSQRTYRFIYPAVYWPTRWPNCTHPSIFHLTSHNFTNSPTILSIHPLAPPPPHVSVLC